MVDCLKVINKKFTNKNYFSGLISRHQNLKKKSQHKKEVFLKLGLKALSVVSIVGLIFFIFYENFFFFCMTLACMPLCLLLSFVKDFIGEKEIKCMAEIEAEFFYDLRNNHELIKDLSTLVIDDDTQEQFNCIVDNVVQCSDDNTFDCFHRLLDNYDCAQSDADTVSERNEFLQKLKIDVRQKSEDTQESFQVKARERVLEML